VRKYLLTDVYVGRRPCRLHRSHDRTVSIPPYLRPIEEESDNDDQLDSSTRCQVMTSVADARDVITPRPPTDSLQHDVTARGDKDETSGSDCRCPVSDRAANDVITTDQCPCNEGGGTCRTGENDVILESPSRDAHPNATEGGTNWTDGNDVIPNDVIPDDVMGESRSKQHWRLFYVIIASLTAFIACLTSMSPSCVIFVVTVTSLIAHHAIQS